MTYHVNLFLRSGITPIASIMQRLLTGYAVKFNTGHGKSILCEEETYLRYLVAHIHLNPVRAGIIEDVGQKGDAALI